LFLDFFILLGQTWSNAFRFRLDPVRPWIVKTLSTVHMQREQWRMQKMKGRRRGKGRALAGDVNDRGQWWATIRYSYATWTMVENVENEGEGEGEKQWLAVETVEAGGELLFIVHLQNSDGECRKRRRRRERGEGEK